ncbi:peptidase [Bremerella sp. TYQ1]|uniref:peptidase n=1 Tax=Bremerella sp. TYQ1 TaxID=3119568 RepID=UPI001CCEA72B|nr:peptidase [Bremerella volcania]UBM37123.1 peptidase [Bremerella volcania]
MGIEHELSSCPAPWAAFRLTADGSLPFSFQVYPMPTRREAILLGSSIALSISGAFPSPAVHASDKSDSKKIIGPAGFEFEITHDWPDLPAKYQWQTTHNVAVDEEQNLYVIHEGRADLKDHPSIFVFDKDGKFIRAFGEQFQGGGHGIEVRKEGNEEFLYVCAYQQVKSFAKLTKQGETLWEKRAPMESGVYAEGEAANPEKVWGRDRFMPTNFAFLENGDFYLADGYGSFFIHHYDKEGNWKAKFGGPGKGKGTFATPHGIWIDARKKDNPQTVVCDRAHHTLQVFDADGTNTKTVSGFGLPANLDTWNDWMIVPELHARLSILDTDYNVLAQLGDDVKRVTSDRSLRTQPNNWQLGKFVHPHDACFDANGNIFVAEWVSTGRVSKMTRLT